MWQRLLSVARRAHRKPARSARYSRNSLGRFEPLEQRALLAAIPVGSELIVADTLPQHLSSIRSVAVAVPDAGGAIVAYNALGISGSRMPGDDREIFVQRFGADGLATGDLIVANPVTRGQQDGSSISSASDGSFWVTWSGRGAGDRVGVYAQRFAADGARLGSVLLVNTTIGGSQSNPDVAVAGDGTAVVVWEGVGAGDVDGIFVRVINPDGTFGSTEVLVNQTTIGQQSMPSVAISNFGLPPVIDDGDGSLPGFVVTWSSRDEDGSDWGIFARGFDQTGAPEGAAFRVNTTTDGSQYRSDIDAADDGSFTIAWSNFSSANGWDVMAQRYLSDGATTGAEFMLHSTATGQQQDVAVSVASGGEILAAWTHGEPNGDGWETQGRTFNNDGTADGVVFIAHQSNSGANSGRQAAPAVGLNDNGDALIVYQGEGTNQRVSAFAQRYTVDVQPAENVAPVISSIADQRVTIGETFTFTVRATDANSRDTLSYRLDPSQSPSDATITRVDNNSATLSWTPDINDRIAGQQSTPIEFRVFVDDNGVTPLSDSASFIVFIDNVAPIVDLNGSDQGGTTFAVTLPENQMSIDIVDTDAVVTDADQTTIESMTITIRNPDDPTAESLQVVTQGTMIVASYQQTTSRLTLTGTDTPANYQRVLRTLSYTNTTAVRPRSNARLIDVVANDGSASNTAATVTLTVQGANVVPTLAEIANVALLGGSPLHIPLDGMDADGDTITYTVTSSSSLVTPTVLAGNRSARVTVTGFGVMVFELFEAEAPRATEHIIQLATAGFYDGIIFHRVAANFVIQAGDPLGTGSGGSTLGNFDDQFDPDLQHNRVGVLSMAKTVDDTNDSQFFVTDTDTRFLDFNHTVFGQLIEGDSVREAIQNVSVDGGSKPLTDVVIESFEIFTDNENGLLRLSAPEGASGSTMITVTASDGRGGTTVRQFNVTVTPDAEDNAPFLGDIPQLTTLQDVPITFQLQATDLEIDPVIFLDQQAMMDPTIGITPLQLVSSPNLQYSVDSATGLLTITPINGLLGTHRFTVGVAQPDLLRLQNGGQVGPFDLQVVEIVINSRNT